MRKKVLERLNKQLQRQNATHNEELDALYKKGADFHNLGAEERANYQFPTSRVLFGTCGLGEFQGYYYIPVYYKLDPTDFVLGSEDSLIINELHISKQDCAFKLIADILEETGCHIKEDGDKIIIYKEKDDKDQKYDIYYEQEK
jgi:hypothetical protein